MGYGFGSLLPVSSWAGSGCCTPLIVQTQTPTLSWELGVSCAGRAAAETSLLLSSTGKIGPGCSCGQSSCDLLLFSGWFLGLGFVIQSCFDEFAFPSHFNELSRFCVASPLLEVPKIGGKAGLVLPSLQALLWQIG